MAFAFTGQGIDRLSSSSCSSREAMILSSSAASAEDEVCVCLCGSVANLKKRASERAANKIMNEGLIEKLLETWGSKKDPKYKESPILALVSIGYKIGHQWASRQNADDLLSRFEEFYTDLINDQLTKQRYNMLYEKLDPASIIAEKPDMMSQAFEDPKVAEAMLGNYHLFENGIVWGLMSVIRKIIEEGKST